MALDYILNRCNEQDIEAVAAAVVRRRRDIAMCGGMSVQDPRRMAKEISAQLNIEGSIEGLQASIKNYAIRIIKQQAPELADNQIEELTRAWLPEWNIGPVEPRRQVPSSHGKKTPSPAESAIPQDMLVSMVNQFVLFSLGRMEDEEDHALRKEMGPWPDKYWQAFPQAIRLFIKDLLKGEMVD